MSEEQNKAAPVEEVAQSTEAEPQKTVDANQPDESEKPSEATEKVADETVANKPADVQEPESSEKLVEKNDTEAVPEADSKEAEPAAEQKEAEPVVESKEAEPAVDSKEAEPAKELENGNHISAEGDEVSNGVCKRKAENGAEAVVDDEKTPKKAKVVDEGEQKPVEETAA